MFVRLNVWFGLVFYYLQLFQENEGRTPLPLNTETLTCPEFWKEGKEETSFTYSNSIFVHPNRLRGPLPPSSTEHGARAREEEIALIVNLPGYKRKKYSKSHSPTHFQVKSPQKLGEKNLISILLLHNIVPDMVFGFIFIISHVLNVSYILHFNESIQMWII